MFLAFLAIFSASCLAFKLSSTEMSALFMVLDETPFSNNSLRIIDELKNFCLTLDSVHQVANFSSFNTSSLPDHSATSRRRGFQSGKRHR